MLEFAAFPVWANVVVFVAAAAVVWIAGTKLAVYAGAIADLTGLGAALIGVLLLGGITSLPEIAVSFTASLTGNAALAVNNILGSVALQVVVIAVGDFVLGGRALTSVVGSPRVLLQGVFGCLLLCLVIAGVSVGDVRIFGIGAWGAGILGAALVFLWLISYEREREAWEPVPKPQIGEIESSPNRPTHLKTAIRLAFVAGLAIVIAGFLLARTGEALAEQTGLGSSFVGALFVGVSTSLPEISTVVSAVRLRRYLLAFSDIFGTNIINIALIGVVDVVYLGGPVLNEVGTFSVFAAMLGIAVTLVYLAGLVERRDRTLWRLGIDSWGAIAIALGGVAVLYVLR